MSDAPPELREDDRRLLEFLRDRDAACPLCDYNLRNLTQPACPECRQTLSLTVGIGRLRLGWMILAIAPGIFSGMAAPFFALILVAATLSQGQLPPWFAIAMDLFGWASGIATIVLIVYRPRFLRMRAEMQCLWALIIWTIHIGVFIGMILHAFSSRASRDAGIAYDPHVLSA